MAALTLVYDGSNNQEISAGSTNYPTSSNGSLSVTTPAGSNIIVLLAGFGITGVADSAGNIYTKAAENDTNDCLPLLIFTCPNCVSLPSSGHMIVSGSGLDFWGWITYAAGYNHGVDRVAFNDSPSALNTTVSTGSLSQSNELAVSFLVADDLTAFNESSSFTTLSNNPSNSNGFAFDIAFRVVTSAASVAYIPSWASEPAQAYDCIVVTFKGTSGGGNFGTIFG